MVREKAGPQRSVVRLRENCELCDIRLVEALCKQQLREGPLPKNLEIGVLAKAKMNRRKERILYYPTVVAVARYDDSADSDSPLMIQAKYRVEYKITANISDAAERDLEEFVHNAANLHIWPYFRELVQSFTCKMGLPALTIPLYDPNGFLAKVTDELTRPDRKKTIERIEHTTKKKKSSGSSPKPKT